MKFLRKKSKNPASQAKDRIQKLLTAIVRIRDGCIFRHYSESGACNGYIAADHIISRVYSACYADLRNVVGSCQRHHIFWKPQNPILYASLVERHIGKERWAWIQKAQIALQDRKPVKMDWQKEILFLQQELRKYE